MPLDHILKNGSLTIKDFDRICSEVNRRSLQRDLKAMVDKGLLIPEGATNKLDYRIKKDGLTLMTNLRQNLRQTYDTTRDRP